MHPFQNLHNFIIWAHPLAWPLSPALSQSQASGRAIGSYSSVRLRQALWGIRLYPLRTQQ